MPSQTIDLAGRQLLLESGTLAKQAHGAVCVRLGDTIVLATAVSTDPREGIDFFPLMVEYEAKMYAAGKIPGTRYMRREGRPPESSILAARRIDRCLRPLFPEGFKDEVQIVVTPLSVDQENSPDVLGIVAASAALSISQIQFNGPLGAVRVAKIADRFVVNPTFQELEESELDMVVAGNKDGAIMLEVVADEVPEETIEQAVAAATPVILEIIAAQERLRADCGKEKKPFAPPQVGEDIAAAVASFNQAIIGSLINRDKAARDAALKITLAEIKTKLAEQFPEREKEIGRALEAKISGEFRRLVLEENKRPDERGPEQVREITCEIGLLPRAHGSGLFSRGQTQVLSTVTLGTVGEEQLIDDLGMEESKRYMHHYNFPPFSVGEVKPMRGPSRRDVGHGSLAEKALLAVLPEEEEFPYTIRVVSDVLESNGSSSMASVCGSTLALMDAGVPIRSAVAGISVGLVTVGEKYKLLTDIQGLEDHDGDMDFKVAGTKQGVTAIQLDVKCGGLVPALVSGALQQAKRARLDILEKMASCIAAPRADLAAHAPRIYTIEIDPAKIGAVIGTGGRVIRKIQADHEVKVDVEDDGRIFIAATNAESAQAALNEIEALTKDIEVGEIYQGKVVRIAPFGAFVELVPGKDGLLHISQLSTSHVERVEDVLSMGDTVEVRVTEIDPQGKVRLVRNDLPEIPDSRPRGGGGGSREGGSGGGGRGRRR
jgi:polyribonucleotide nucleotidyltransferase